MTDLTKDEVSAVAQKAGCAWLYEPLAQRFAALCRAPLVAEVERLKKDLSTVDVILEECKMDWSGDVTQIKAEHVHGLLALQADRDDWKARAEAAGAELARVRAVPSIKQFTGAIHAGQKQRPGESNKGTSQIPWTHTVGACAEVGNGANEHLQYRVGQTNAERSDHQCNSGCSGVSSGGAVCSQVTPPQPAAQEQTSAVPVVRQMVEALERKLPGGKQTDDFESSRIGDYNQGWNDYRKAVKKMFKNINMNSSENSNPDAYLYSLEYGEKVVDTKVSIHQLNYPFGVAGADYLVRNDDGVSYVRQTKLYAALSRALAAGQKFIKENGK